MKLSFSVSLLPVLLSYIAYTSAYPINSYNAEDLVGREAFPTDNEIFIRSDFEANLAARGLRDKIPFLKKKQRSQAEEAERKQRKIWKEQHKLNKQIHKHVAKVAKIENGPDHKVEAKWKPGHLHEEELGKVAHKQIEKYWKNNPEMQQFKHAEVSAKRKPDGTIWTTARYHNGGSSFSGSTVHMFS